MQCTVDNYESGEYYVDVFVKSKGYASIGSASLAPGPIRNASDTSAVYPDWLTLKAVVTGMSPTTGSLAGGTSLMITGSGFSHVPSRLSVTLGSITCEVVASNSSDIVCVTGHSGSAMTNAALSVTVNGMAAEVTGLGYSYSQSDTPMVSGASLDESTPEHTISGSGFGSQGAVQIVPLGEGFDFLLSSGNCVIGTYTTTSIVCEPPLMPAGPYEVLVLVSGKGLSMENATGVAQVTYSLRVDSFSPSSLGNGGGFEMTITGSGFPTFDSTFEESTGDDFSISICNAACEVLTSNVSSVVCLVGINPVANPLTTDSNCPVVAQYMSISAPSAGMFDFLGSLTPSLAAISPSTGGTAGGTIMEITGSSLLPPGVTNPNTLVAGDVTVLIGGSPCEWFGKSVPLPNDTLIQCRTSDHQTTTTEAQVSVRVRDRGLALYIDSSTGEGGQLFFEYVDLWSSVYTWGGNPIPVEGESVYIKAGQTVILDISTPILNLILIEGALIFDDSQDLHLNAKYIFINGGKFQVCNIHMHVHSLIHRYCLFL